MILIGRHAAGSFTIIIYRSWATFILYSAFGRVAFNNSLFYENGIYRTPYLHPIFASKRLLLKEKKLLEVEQLVEKNEELMECSAEWDDFKSYSHVKNFFEVAFVFRLQETMHWSSHVLHCQYHLV